MTRAPTSTRRILLSALAALVSGFGIFALATGFDAIGLLRVVEVGSVVVLGASIITGTIVLTLVHFANWQSPASEDDFEALVQRAERLAVEDPWSADEYGDFGDTEEYDAVELDSEEDFRALVRSAIDELPLEFHRALEHVAVVVSDGGAAVRTGRGRRGAYGLYQGDTIVHNHFHERIVIFRDTLMRDFGHDPDLLREQVTRTVRHELAHHLGWDEHGVSDLGL
ncbi:MAG TPA: metallopeptidase family protein [Solirubrobacteraceae bacterium]|jgi:predicted Zn-dependent protease with MMP-like domain|nr:metallopeptidase family protein [Solirubrobacteraceae bacterium]